MAATAASRKTISIHDYPEHLNPFHEEDNHNKIRFWTIGRKLTRSNSISFSGIKELKNSWAFRSFMKKGKKGQSSQENKSNQLNGESSPVVYRRAMQYSSASMAGARSTVGSPERAERYVYGGSVTPLPRSRFQERLRNPSQHEVNSLSLTPRMARSDVTGSRLSVGSTNPFDEDPIPPVRASRRKKKRAPPPPPGGVADISISSETSELHISEPEDKVPNVDGDLEIEDVNMNVELKIVEDEDDKAKHSESPAKEPQQAITPEPVVKTEITEVTLSQTDKENGNVPEKPETTTEQQSAVKTSTSEHDILNSVSFPKVDITKYRRNSSVNEDDIRLRRGNLEDFHALSNKRSKSLTNALDSSYITYDINLNENTDKDDNGNDEPHKVVCKLYDDMPRKQSVDVSISSTEKEFLEIDKATRELEREISKLNSALNDDDLGATEVRLSFSEIKRKFDKNDTTSPNPIPKPRRSHYGGNSPVNGNSLT